MGNGKTQAFAAGKGGAIFSNDRLIALRQLLDELVAVGGLGGGHHVLVCGVLAAYALFSITVLLNSTTFWNTTEKSFIRAVESMGAMSVPPSVILPLSTS